MFASSSLRRIDMKIYYIAVSSWDGNHAYTLDYIRPFLSKQKRDEAYEKMKLSPAYKKGAEKSY